MKAIIYSTSWCVACRDMSEYVQQHYPAVELQFVPLDRMSPRLRDRTLDAIRKLTWSDELPVTLIDDTVILGTDYAALIAILGPGQALPPAGSAQHRHALDQPAA